MCMCVYVCVYASVGVCLCVPVCVMFKSFVRMCDYECFSLHVCGACAFFDISDMI